MADTRPERDDRALYEQTIRPFVAFLEDQMTDQHLTVADTRPGQYVRDHYHVPAFINRQVRFTWPESTPPRTGKITGFRGARLLVRFPDSDAPVILHPTWQIEYLPGDDHG